MSRQADYTAVRHTYKICSMRQACAAVTKYATAANISNIYFSLGSRYGGRHYDVRLRH